MHGFLKCLKMSSRFADPDGRLSAEYAKRWAGTAKKERVLLKLATRIRVLQDLRHRYSQLLGRLRDHHTSFEQEGTQLVDLCSAHVRSADRAR